MQHGDVIKFVTERCEVIGDSAARVCGNDERETGDSRGSAGVCSTSPHPSLSRSFTPSVVYLTPSTNDLHTHHTLPLGLNVLKSPPHLGLLLYPLIVVVSTWVSARPFTAHTSPHYLPSLSYLSLQRGLVVVCSPIDRYFCLFSSSPCPFFLQSVQLAAG